MYVQLPVMQSETSLVRELLFANLTEILFLTRVSKFMIKQVCLCLEAWITKLTSVRPIIWMYQLMSLKQLFML